MTAVTIIRIGRPQVRNAIDSTTAQRLYREFANFEADPGAKVAVLYGDEKAFKLPAPTSTVLVCRMPRRSRSCRRQHRDGTPQRLRVEPPRQ